MKLLVLTTVIKLFTHIKLFKFHKVYFHQRNEFIKQMMIKRTYYFGVTTNFSFIEPNISNQIIKISLFSLLMQSFNFFLIINTLIKKGIDYLSAIESRQTETSRSSQPISMTIPTTCAWRALSVIVQSWPVTKCTCK